MTIVAEPAAHMPTLVAFGALVLRRWWSARKKTALLVLNCEKTILEARAEVLKRRLRTSMADQGLVPLRAGGTGRALLLDESLACDATTLDSARSRGADYLLVVSLHDLSCEVDESRLVNLARMRVNTTLCVAYQILEVASGHVLAGQTLALCRTTPPIVSGTGVGGEVLDKLLGEAADRISECLGSLRLAA
jgi:hypothetical protein